MKTAVVTGAAGFLGTYLCKELIDNGYLVTGLIHKNTATLFSQLWPAADISTLNFTRADIQNPEELKSIFVGADVVFHCAALVSFKAKDTPLLFEINVKGTRNVVNACLAAGVKNLIHASSVAALGRKTGDNHIDENSVWLESKYNTPYAVSKHLAELEVFRGRLEGLNIGIINPGIILGLGNGKSSGDQFVSHIKSGIPFYPGGINGFVGVNDVAKMMMMLYEQNDAVERVLAVAENLSYKFVLDSIAKNLSAKAPRFELRGLMYMLFYNAAKLLEFLHIPSPFPSKGIRNTATKTHYSTQNFSLKEWISYTPIETVIQEEMVNNRP